jgi:hypothetical protein
MWRRRGVGLARWGARAVRCGAVGGAVGEGGGGGRGGWAHLHPVHVSRFDPKVPHFSRYYPRVYTIYYNGNYGTSNV